MSTAAFLRVKKLKGSGIIKAAARHNRREIQAELGADSHIDPARSRLNQTLQGAATADGVALLAKELMLGAGVGSLRKDAVMCIEALCSLPPDTAIDDTSYFTDCAIWVAAHFGGVQNILSVDIHRDEGALHCHVLILPLDANKRMNGGRMLGLRTYKDWQALFYKEVASRYGLKKPPARLTGATKKTAASAVLQRLRETKDTALASKVWATFRDMIERDPAPCLTALGLAVDVSKSGHKTSKYKTMADLAASTGKGAKYERHYKYRMNNAKSIDFEEQEKHRSLCSVDFPGKCVIVSEPVPVLVITTEAMDVSQISEELSKNSLIESSAKHHKTSHSKTDDAHKCTQPNAYRSEQPNVTKHNETQIYTPKYASRNEQKQAENEGLIDRAETVRVRDDQILADYFDHETGEFHEPVVKIAGLRRVEAENYVKSALGNIGKFPRNGE
jgi:Plasmid recombination enzyme